MTDLVGAAQRTNLSEVRRLLARGHDASERDLSNGESALHAVCSANANPTSERARVAVVQELLNNGADPNARGRYDWTPLHYACWRNHPEIVALLLKAGADPEARTARRTPSSMPAGIATTAGDTARDQAQKAGHAACVMAIDAYQAEVHYGLQGTDCGELGPGGGGKFKHAGTGALPSGSRHMSADDPDAGGRVQHVGHSRPCLDESHLRPAPAWGPIGDSVGDLISGETKQVQVAHTAARHPGFAANGVSVSAPYTGPTDASGSQGLSGPQYLFSEAGDNTLRASVPNSWRRPTRETLPARRAVGEGYASHAAEGSHTEGNPSAPWAEPPRGSAHDNLVPHGQGLDATGDSDNTGAGWSTAYSALPPGARMISSGAGRRAEPGCGNRMLHPNTAYLKLQPTTALTTLRPDVYATAGRLMGEHPVTAKPGHLPRDTMLPADNAELPRDSERFAEYRPTGYAYDYESGQQHLSKDHRPALKDDGVTAVKGTSRWTTDFPGRHYTHTGAAKGVTNTYHVPGAHYPWPEFDDVKDGQGINLIYQQGKVGPRRPVNEPAHGGL
jgi:hypothetical protein